MGISDALASAYAKLEDGYFDILDFLDARGIPVYGYSDFLEDRGIPSFPFTIAILVVIAILLYMFLIVGFAMNVTMVMTLEDDTGDRLTDVFLQVEDSEGRRLFTDRVNNAAEVEITGVARGETLFLKATKYGQAMVASAQNPDGAILQGIGPNKMASLSMGIGCALAAAGGVLAGSMFQMGPYMGLLSLVKGLLIIVLGGLGSLPGAIIAGMSLGIIDGLFPILFGHAWASLSPLFFVIVVLVFKPQGLFGHE